jgi:hypothetical protein
MLKAAEPDCRKTAGIPERYGAQTETDRTRLEKSREQKRCGKNLQNLLFKRKEEIVVNKLAKKVDLEYKELNQHIVVGSLGKTEKELPGRAK